MNEVRLREAPRVPSRGQRGDLWEGDSKKRRGAKANPDLPHDVDRTCPAMPEARKIATRPLSNYVSFSERELSEAPRCTQQEGRDAHWEQLLASSWQP